MSDITYYMGPDERVYELPAEAPDPVPTRLQPWQLGYDPNARYCPTCERIMDKTVHSGTFALSECSSWYCDYCDYLMPPE